MPNHELKMFRTMEMYLRQEMRSPSTGNVGEGRRLDVELKAKDIVPGKSWRNHGGEFWVDPSPDKNKKYLSIKEMQWDLEAIVP